ncbi:unnamed protein product [Rotaria magnacalcarata]|uniref:Cytochrome b5 domain-containing protein 1 n=4 Tax=Rotaria magnacalcarata TaxID=392030 RepID=A0A816S8N0_9BILA|nr:unnamed protein product [Rotaria magnacalcarata]CAF2083294.1 unnamed protein product [Rotaria magnacalcarata]
MDEKLLPIGIDSDHIDGLFTVVTGPMGHQQVNYHIIDEERSHQKSKNDFPNESAFLKPQLSSSTHNNEFLDSEILTNLSPRIDIEQMDRNKISDNYDRTARFSLPEIDSSNQYQIKNINNSLRSIRKEQSISNRIINRQEKSEQNISSSSSTNQSTIEIPTHCRPPINNTLQQQAESLLPFYIFNELAQHNDSTDAWICIFTYIYDITSLIQKTRGTVVYQLLSKYAGQDISSWFDEQTLEPRKRIDPHTHESVLLVQPLSIIETFGTPFWKTKDLLIGRLAEHSRYIRLIHNFAPKESYLLEIAEEETIGQIAKKFLKHNSHGFSYIWQYDGKKLDFNKTLTGNGMPNEECFHDQYGWRSDNENCPTIILYFSDDLTIA